MKAISIRQPWAWLIVHGHKPVENRTWATSHRGDTLIHAGKVFDDEGLHSVLAAFPHMKAVLPQQYELGGIVGMAQLVNCVQQHPSPYFTGPYGFVMYQPRPLRLVRMQGQLGIFDVPMCDALHAALHATDPATAEAAGQNRLFC